jgi:hypothetical protein
LKCRYKEQFEYVIASQENASYILDKIGFGAHKCAETFHKDKRYGTIDIDRLNYGFENSMYGSIQYGRYVVFGCNYDEWFGGYKVLTESEFNEEFEIC